MEINFAAILDFSSKFTRQEHLFLIPYVTKKYVIFSSTCLAVYL